MGLDKKPKPTAEDDSFDVDFDALLRSLDAPTEGIPTSVAEEFKAGAREIVREALENLEYFRQIVPVAYRHNMSGARKYLLEQILFNRRLSKREIAARLLELFPEEERSNELVQRIREMLVVREPLFPAYAHSHS